MSEVAPKTPDESGKKYTFDLTAKLGQKGTTIVSVSSTTVNPTGLTLGSTTFTTVLINVFVSGGTADTEYAVTVTYVTGDGQTLQDTMVIMVRNPS